MSIPSGRVVRRNAAGWTFIGGIAPPRLPCAALFMAVGSDSSGGNGNSHLGIESVPHEDDERDLIAPLIEGMVEDPPWSTFLARLRARLGADYVSIVFRPHSVGAERKPPGRGKVVHLHVGHAWPDWINRIYRANDQPAD